MGRRKMSRFHSTVRSGRWALLTSTLIIAGTMSVSSPVMAEGNAMAGEKVFKKCAACHAVGNGADHKLGPHLNDLFGRVAGTSEGFSKYSPAIKQAGEDGLVWTAETLDAYLENPRKAIPKNRMSFAGLRKESERGDVIAFLKQFSGAGDSASGEAKPKPAPAPAARSNAAPPASDYEPSKGRFRLGRVAMPAEVAAWDIDIRPDGAGLPKGKGTVAEGEVLYTEKCASCHGDFGEGRDRWPVLAGGQGTLRDERPVKTVGSYWPFLSTVYDYVRRAMPFGDARSLSDDDVYAITAYILYLNDVVTEEDFELSDANFAGTKLPNEGNFIPDGRGDEPHWKANAEPCMTNCSPQAAEVVMRARVLDVTPDADEEGQSGGID